MTLISTAIQLYFDYRQDVSAIEQRLDEIEESYLASIAAGLWNVDITQLKLQLEGILRLPDMKAAIVQEDGLAVSEPISVSFGQKSENAALSRVFTITYREGDVVRDIGSLYVEASFTGVYNRLFNKAIVILLTQGVKTFLVSMFILYIFNWLVTQHLSTIANYVRSYNFNSALPTLSLNRRKPHKDDELDAMVRAYNAMCQNLLKAYDELKDVNAKLEDDIAAQREYEERLLYQAHYDLLTGLANRVLMFDRLDHAISTAQRNQCYTALLCIDLDQFKNVNDTMGHGVGDQLLVQAAQRLTACVRECDTLARIGGDEFVIILPEISEKSLALQVAERIINAFTENFHIADQDHFVTASVGISLYPLDGKDHQILLRNADLAMYKAKEAGRNCFHFFTEEINQALSKRLELERELRGAVEHGELVLHYQPVFDLKSGIPIALEALIRWQQPNGSLRAPDQFIPIAEDMGLLQEIGDWVLERACAEIAALNKSLDYQLRVAINVSPKQLQEAGFGDSVKRHLDLSGLCTDNLELEITERVLMDDSPETDTNLKKINDMGIRLSIDDFGTGYSSLGYLQKYIFHTLKIDRSFVGAAIIDTNTRKLVETIITMAHGLGLEVIAEGVENLEQAQLLKQKNCNMVQGFYYARPAPITEISRYFASLPNIARAPLG
ncbi:EAL domain-containing protein [Motiliproteus sp. MSK22-1]|uniref:bifunctional diguanylate cyclase/phosphodiesterase n=1 Tax=Motiliproteus sp. MSK22-1 TaxID=1897630 RepID=UPI002100F06F|nr:EAL domain-containing protein [Motiliproteus sp. MSK22-1]